MRFLTALQLLLLSTLFLLPIQAQVMSAEEQAFAKAERYYTFGKEVADRHEKARYMDYAIGLYKSYLDRFPRGGNIQTVYFHMGHAQQSIGRIDEARAVYRSMINTYRRGHWVGLSAQKMAWLAYTNKDWAEAARYFKIASKEIKQKQGRFSAMTKYAESLLNLNRADEAIKALTTIIESRGHPHAEWAQFMLGYQYYQNEQFTLTIKALKPLLREQTNSTYRSQAMFYTGLSSTELGQSDEGEDYLLQVLDLSLTNPALTREQRRQIAHNKTLAQTTLMNLHFREKNYPEVIRLLRLGDFGARGRTEARRSMIAGQSFYQLKRYRDARTAFRKVDRAVPNTPTAFDASYRCLLCDYQLKQPSLPDRVDVFLELYQPHFESSPNIHMANFLKAETLYDFGKFEAAAQAFSKVDPTLFQEQQRAGLLFKRGWCLAEMGDNNGAMRNFTQFIDSFPGDTRRSEAIAKRAEAYFLLGNHSAALRDYETLLKEKPDPELLSFALQGSARALREEKKYPLMIGRYRRLLTEHPDLPADTAANCNYWIGWGYFKQEQHSKAVPYLKKAQELVPEFYNEPAGNLLVLLTFAQGDAHAMHEVLNQLLADFPGKLIPSHMLTWLGLQLFHDGQFIDSVRYLERTVDPENPTSTDINVWRTLAKGQNELEKYAEALAAANIVLELERHPKWKADTLLDIAQAQLGLKELDAATESAQSGLDINVPGTHTAGLHLILGKIAFQREQYQKALDEFEATSRIVIDDPVVTPQALYWAAQSAEKLEDHQKAATLRTSLKASFPKWKAPESAENGGN